MSSTVEKSRKPGRTTSTLVLDRKLIPEPFNLTKDPERALRLYCNDLLLQLKTPSQAEQLLVQVIKKLPDGVGSVDEYVQQLITDELDTLNSNKKELFEQLVFRGLAVALQQNNLPQYFKGLALLKDSYGISRNVVATIKDDRPLFSSAFIAMKAKEGALLDAQLDEDQNPDKKE